MRRSKKKLPFSAIARAFNSGATAYSFQCPVREWHRAVVTGDGQVRDAGFDESKGGGEINVGECRSRAVLLHPGLGRRPVEEERHRRPQQEGSRAAQDTGQVWDSPYMAYKNFADKIVRVLNRQHGLRQPQGFSAVSEACVAVVDGEKGSLYDVRNKVRDSPILLIVRTEFSHEKKGVPPERQGLDGRGHGGRQVRPLLEPEVDNFFLEIYFLSFTECLFFSICFLQRGPPLSGPEDGAGGKVSGGEEVGGDLQGPSRVHGCKERKNL